MKLLHASDFHLDSHFERLDPQRGQQRRQELRELPFRLVELARAEGAQLILLPGDLFDGERVYPESVEALEEALSQAGMPVVIAPGNHDCIRSGSPYLTRPWPDNVHIFTGPRMEAFELPALRCVVHGCAFTGPHREDEPLAGFAAPRDGRTHLLCVHGDVGLAGTYGPIPPAALAASGADYAALGHVHAPSGLQWAGDTPWAYCGCPEGRGFDECGQRGALLVTVGDGGVEAAFRPLCRRQYRIEEVPVEDFAAGLAALPQGDLARLILTGESERLPDLAALTRQAQERLFYAEVRDMTTLPRTLWERAEEDNLTGLFLRETRRRLDEAEEDARPALLLAARFGLAALEGREDVCP